MVWVLKTKIFSTQPVSFEDLAKTLKETNNTTSISKPSATLALAPYCCTEVGDFTYLLVCNTNLMVKYKNCL